MFAKTIYGVEYNPNPIGNDSHGLGWLLIVVIVLTLISLGWTLISRYRDDAPQESVKTEESLSEEPLSAVTNAPAVAPLPKPKPIPNATSPVRPQKVRVLLQRLEEARKSQNVELEISTMEKLRSLSGAPAADLDDSFARRLGVLNMRRLFIDRNRLWVKEIEVRSGQSASRIAIENGSTLESFSRLNGGKIDKIYAGKKMYVMDHPRFQLVVHCRLMMADLVLNGKFFKRYDILRPVSGKAGAYETPNQIRQLLNSIGVEFSRDDRAELEMMIPKGSPVVVSEM